MCKVVFFSFQTVYIFCFKDLEALLSKVFVVMDEVRQLPLPVDHVAGAADRASQRTRTAAEHTNLTHLQK